MHSQKEGRQRPACVWKRSENVHLNAKNKIAETNSIERKLTEKKNGGKWEEGAAEGEGTLRSKK